MNLNISGHHLSLTPALKEYVASKLKRVERHFDHLINADIILSVEKVRHKAEATIHARGIDLHAEEICEDMYAAIDGMVDKLDQQTRKLKDKVRDHHARDVAKRQTH